MLISLTSTIASGGTATAKVLENPLEILWGFVFVLIVLAILALVTQVIGKLFKTFAPAATPKTVSGNGGGVSPQQNDEVAAVISASIHTVISEPHRIVSINPKDK